MAGKFEYVDLEDFWVESVNDVDFSIFDVEMWQLMTDGQSQNAAHRAPIVVDGKRYIYQHGEDPEVGYLYTSPDNANQVVVRQHIDPTNLVLNLRAAMVNDQIQITGYLLSGHPMLQVVFPANKRIFAQDVIKQVREVCGERYGITVDRVKVIASGTNKPLRVSDGIIWKPAGCRRRYVFKPLNRVKGKTFIGFMMLRKFFLPNNS